MDDERHLLKRFLRTGSSVDFEPIVSQFIKLVYSTALRVMPEQRDQIEDVCQTVFSDLSCKAAMIPDQTSLAGWLYRHTYFVAANLNRSERRRKERERQAMEMSDTNRPEGVDHVPNEELHLAMNELPRNDRDALVLRYLDERDLRGVGQGLGISEDAAQKRVSRALEKLRAILSRKGITATLASLTLSLAQQVTAAPATMAVKTIAAAAVGGLGSIGLIPTMIELMKTPIAKVATILLIGGGVAASMNHQSGRIDSLLTENLALVLQTTEMVDLKRENERLQKLAIDPDDLLRLKNQAADVHRLRAEIGALRRDLTERPTVQAPAPSAAIEESPARAATEVESQIMMTCRVISRNPESSDPNAGSVWLRQNAAAILNNEQYKGLMKTIRTSDGLDIIAGPRVVTLSGRQAQIAVVRSVPVITGYQLAPDGSGMSAITTNIHCGPVATMTATLGVGQGTIRMEVEFESTEFHGYLDTGSETDVIPIVDTLEGSGEGILMPGQSMLMHAKSELNPEGIWLLITPEIMTQTNIATLPPKKKPAPPAP